MSNQTQPKILTEEELNELSVQMKDRLFHDRVTDYAYMDFEKVVASHRQLLSANAELSFKKQNNKILLEKALGFIEAIVGFTGQNLEVFNWHQNGDGEPLDNFIDENLDATLLDELKSALEELK